MANCSARLSFVRIGCVGAFQSVAELYTFAVEEIPVIVIPNEAGRSWGVQVRIDAKRLCLQGGERLATYYV